MDKRGLLERLSTMQVLERVLPTAPMPSSPAMTEMRSAAPQPEFREALKSADVGAVRSASDRLLERATAPNLVEKNLTAELAEDERFQEQVIAFAAAGFALFKASAELLARPLSDRRTAGASGVVTRVLRDDKDRLLLETDKAIVRFADDVAEQKRGEILGGFDAVVIDSSGLPPGALRIRFTRGRAVDHAIEMLAADEIVYTEPDFIEHIGLRHRPTDPDYALQWHLRNTQTPGADLSVETAWDHVTGNGVSVAVVDNGFDAQHPDIRFGDRSGWYRYTPNHDEAEFVAGIIGMPSGNHGTRCAGMAAGIAGNNLGGCGVAYDATLQAIACTADSILTQSTLARAIAYAADPALETNNAADSAYGADVIACSLGPNGATWSMRQILSDAIDYAVANGRGGRGTAIFWACTNGPHPISLDEVCSHASVIPVGLSTSADQDDNCGHGPELAFLAPGTDVHVPNGGGGYTLASGTSYACPCAAAVAALVLEAHPACTYQEVRTILANSCDRIGSLPYTAGRNDTFGAGRVNADKAVSAAVVAAAAA